MTTSQNEIAKSCLWAARKREYALSVLYFMLTTRCHMHVTWCMLWDEYKAHQSMNYRLWNAWLRHTEMVTKA
jgi:hypothetical protein